MLLDEGDVYKSMMRRMGLIACKSSEQNFRLGRGPQVKDWKGLVGCGGEVGEKS
jgi:hypothetical protein